MRTAAIPFLNPIDLAQSVSTSMYSNSSGNNANCGGSKNNGFGKNVGNDNSNVSSNSVSSNNTSNNGNSNISSATPITTSWTSTTNSSTPSTNSWASRESMEGREGRGERVRREGVDEHPMFDPKVIDMDASTILRLANYTLTLYASYFIQLFILYILISYYV